MSKVRVGGSIVKEGEGETCITFFFFLQGSEQELKCPLPPYKKP